MFGALTTGNLVFGRTPWGLTPIYRENPDIDGIYIPILSNEGELEIPTFTEGIYIPTLTLSDTLDRIK